MAALRQVIGGAGTDDAAPDDDDVHSVGQGFIAVDALDRRVHRIF